MDRIRRPVKPLASPAAGPALVGHGDGPCAGKRNPPAAGDFMGNGRPRMGGKHRRIFRTACPNGGSSPRRCGSRAPAECGREADRRFTAQPRDTLLRPHGISWETVRLERDSRTAIPVPACDARRLDRSGSPDPPPPGALAPKPHPGLSPRVRGNRMSAGFVDDWSGLSPRVRGNPFLPLRVSHVRRSIPACAGKPSVDFGILGADMVYPRVCGETGTVSSSRASSVGLSPRVRGNRAGIAGAGPVFGSIPACAGKPG